MQERQEQKQEKNRLLCSFKRDIIYHYLSQAELFSLRSLNTQWLDFINSKPYLHHSLILSGRSDLDRQEYPTSLEQLLRNFQHLDQVDLRGLRTIAIKSELISQMIATARSISLTHFQEIFNFKPSSYAFLKEKIISIHIDLGITDTQDFLDVMDSLVNLQSVSFEGPYPRIVRIVNMSLTLPKCTEIDLNVLTAKTYEDEHIQAQSLLKLTAKRLTIRGPYDIDIPALPSTLKHLRLSHNKDIKEQKDLPQLESLQVEHSNWFVLHRSMTELIELHLLKTYIPVKEVGALIAKSLNLKIIDIVECYSTPFQLSVANHPSVQRISLTESDYRLVLFNLPKLRSVECNNQLKFTTFQQLTIELIIHKLASHFEIKGADLLYDTCQPVISKDINYAFLPYLQKYRANYCRDLTQLRIKDRELRPQILKQAPIQDLFITQTCLAQSLTPYFQFSLAYLRYLSLETEIAAQLKIVLLEQCIVLHRLRFIGRGSDLILDNRTSSLHQLYCISRQIYIERSQSELKQCYLFLSKIPQMKPLNSAHLSLKLNPQTSLRSHLELQLTKNKSLTVKLFRNESHLPSSLLQLADLFTFIEELNIINFNILQSQIPELCISSPSLRRITLEEMEINSLTLKTQNIQQVSLIASKIGRVANIEEEKVKTDKRSRVKKFQ